MTRKVILTLAVLAAIIVATTLSGCTTTTTTTPTAGGEATPAPTTSGTTTVTGGAPTVTYDGDNFKIAGSKGGSVKANIKEGGYLIEYKHKGYSFTFKMGTSTLNPGGQYPDATTGWAEFEKVQRFYSGGEMEFSVEAKDQYEITFTKLPMSATADTLPKTYSDKGLKVVGPMSLKEGQVNLKISAPDLKQAGFTVELYDGTTGVSEARAVPAGNANNFDGTVPLTIDADGTYLLEVSANGQAEWTIEVSQ
ncbi:hypothetical protein [Methanocella sp. MCL-LM]|uniref:hypothetical protein n=1 Tax=Methanocella sp. MCL-LM TaxID=3412035 RepID=UPI003C733C2A